MAFLAFLYVDSTVGERTGSEVGDRRGVGTRRDHDMGFELGSPEVQLRCILDHLPIGSDCIAFFDFYLDDTFGDRTGSHVEERRGWDRDHGIQTMVTEAQLCRMPEKLPRRLSSLTGLQFLFGEIFDVVWDCRVQKTHHSFSSACYQIFSPLTHPTQL